MFLGEELVERDKGDREEQDRRSVLPQRPRRGGPSTRGESEDKPAEQGPMATFLRWSLQPSVCEKRQSGTGQSRDDRGTHQLDQLDGLWVIGDNGIG